MLKPLDQNNNASLLSVLSLSKDATAIYDSEDLHICFANDAMIAIWSKDRSVIGKTFEEAIPEIVGQPFSELLKQVWHTGETYSANETPADLVVNGQLHTFYFDFEYRAIPDENGKTQYLLHTATDVTERRRSLEMLQQRENELEKANKILQQLNKEYEANNKELEAKNEELVSFNNTIRLLNERLVESKSHFTHLVAQAPVAILVFHGEDLVIEMANPPILDILHRDASIIGKPILESMPELRGEPAVELLFEVYRTGKGSDGVEVPVQMLKGDILETRYFNFSYRPIIDSGKIIGVMDLAVEVTDQVLSRQKLEVIISEKNELEKILRANEQRLQGILDTMAEGVGVIDAKGELVYANMMAQRILGLLEDEIKGRTFNDAKWQNLRVDGAPLPKEEHPMSIMMRTRTPIYDQEIAVQPEKGERFYISINAAPIFDDEGLLTGGIGTFMDVTNRRKISMQKDDFISVASHELKTPVTALKAYLQLLERVQDNAKPEVIQKLIGQANTSMDKLIDLIDKLLNADRISQGRLQIQKHDFILADMINNCCGHLRSGSTYNVILKGDLVTKINADEQQLEQVIVNFVNNAVKYAPQTKDILIEIFDGQHDVKVSVTDFGPGISAEKRPYLFDRYYRADHSGAQFTGLGLGLFISAEIVKKHGGEIGADSEAGKGSTFWFKVPKQ